MTEIVNPESFSLDMSSMETDGTGMADYDMRPDGYADWDDDGPDASDYEDTEECGACRGTGTTHADYGVRGLFAHGPYGENRECDDCAGTGRVEP